MAELPSGTVTLLFSDVEGSTRLTQVLGDGYGGSLAELRQLLRTAVTEAGGHEVDCRADELFAVFQRARDGLAAAAAAQSALDSHIWPEGVKVRVRVGLHTSEPVLEGGAYLGLDVSRAARICAAGHGGQTLLSQTTRELVANACELKPLGVYSLAGLPSPERIFQLVALVCGPTSHRCAWGGSVADCAGGCRGPARAGRLSRRRHSRPGISSRASRPRSKGPWPSWVLPSSRGTVP